MPQVDYIDDDELREQVIDAFHGLVPDYFWYIPSSSSGNYHPHDERGRYGLLVHTQRVVEIFDQLADSWIGQGKITEQERDYGIAAALLHDTVKNGDDKTNGTVTEHGMLAADMFEAMPEEVREAIRSHDGPWGADAEPETPLQELVHAADMVAADDKLRVQTQVPTQVRVWTRLVGIRERINDGIKRLLG